MKIAISGSRDCNEAMCQKVHEVTAWAQAHHHTILVGDAHGIDAVVRDDARRLNIPVEIYGAFNRFRLSFIGGSFKDCHFDSYMTRDHHIVDEADMVIALWNGHSTGTKEVIRYAHSTGKKTVVRIVPNRLATWYKNMDAIPKS